jgi:hypothetical protein
LAASCVEALNIPVCTVDAIFRINKAGGGYILTYRSHNGSKNGDVEQGAVGVFAREAIEIVKCYHNFNHEEIYKPSAVCCWI